MMTSDRPRRSRDPSYARSRMGIARSLAHRALPDATVAAMGVIEMALILKAAQGLENLKSSIARDNIRAIESLLSCNTIARTKITNLSAREDGTGAARGTTSEQPRENDDATVPHERSVFAPTTMAVDVDQREGALQAKPTAGAWTENSNVGSEQGKMSPLPRVIKAITVQNPSGRDRQTSTSTPKSNETPDTKVADINELRPRLAKKSSSTSSEAATDGELSGSSSPSPPSSSPSSSPSSPSSGPDEVTSNSPGNVRGKRSRSACIEEVGWRSEVVVGRKRHCHGAGSVPNVAVSPSSGRKATCKRRRKDDEGAEAEMATTEVISPMQHQAKKLRL